MNQNPNLFKPKSAKVKAKIRAADRIPGEIKRVSRATGYALWLDDANGYSGLSHVLRSRLTMRQRGGLASAALNSLDPDDARALVCATLPEESNAPLAPLFGHMREAAFWADTAEPDALDAYCLASFNAMTPPRQAAFLEFVQGRRAA